MAQLFLPNYDKNEEGCRSFILMTFHPSVTDIHGCFHLMKHFISILGTKLGTSENEVKELHASQNIPQPHEEQQTHLPIEALLPRSSESFNFKGMLITEDIWQRGPQRCRMALIASGTNYTTTISFPFQKFSLWPSLL